MVRPTLYEFAGGDQAVLALARAHHARCLADPELNHPFAKKDDHELHVRRLAAYWAEVLGGPARFTELCGDQTAVVRIHAGNGDMHDLGQRFIECFVAAMDDVDLPPDAEFRRAMRDYMVWATAEMVSYPGQDDVVPRGLAVPRWSWDGLARS